MIKRLALAFGLIIIGIWAFNTPWFESVPDRAISILSHRGVYQTFERDGLTNQTCTAERIHPPTHVYLENTIPSIEAAFNLGADIVEIDVLPTSDGAFVVFHDWTLDCRTNGKGPTHEASLAELQLLDIGYGYTADGGATFPFRGRGVGLMPSLEQVLTAFPDRQFMINMKRNNKSDSAALVAYLDQHALSIPSGSFIWAGGAFAEAWRAQSSDVPVVTRKEVKDCAQSYLLFGWVGHVSKTCTNFGLVVPQDIARGFAGWPQKVVRRLENHDARVFVAAALNSDAQGIDTEQQLAKIPDKFRGWIVTDRIEVVGPAIKSIHPDQCRNSRFGAPNEHAAICPGTDSDE